MKKNIHVVGAVIWRDRKILCAQRGGTKTLPYKWEFPGGKIEEGESPEVALVREIQEEMNCEIVVGKQVQHTVHEYEFGIVHLTTFHCEFISGELMLTEHINIKWLEPKDLHTLDWALADLPAIQKLKALPSLQG